MPKFAANLSMLFNEADFLDRFDAAAAAGFKGVEYLFPYAFPAAEIATRLKDNGLEQVLFNLPAGDFAKGERGYANDPGRRAEFREGVARALEIADRLGCRRLNCLVGLSLPDVEPAAQLETVAENLAWAADETAKAGVLQVVEPLNAFDAPGFLLTTPSQGFALVERVGHPNLKLQYDVYHAQRMEGNLAATIAARVDLIGHIQVADSPDRHQPGTGEIHWPFVFAAIDASGYDGWVSAEYKPLGRTEDTLAWMSL